MNNISESEIYGQDINNITIDSCDKFWQIYVHVQF